MTDVQRPRILIATPVKNGAGYLERYFSNLGRLSYPSELISLGLLEGDSDDDSHAGLLRWAETVDGRYRRCRVWQHHTGFRMPPGIPRWAPSLQYFRRRAIAKARNHLLARALSDEDWVLWLDVDVSETPPDLIERLLAAERDILHPNCVLTPGGESFDRNAWTQGGETHMDDLRGGDDLVRLDSVGGTVLLIRADIHREGLIFPPFLYGAGHRLARRPGPWAAIGQVGEIETEGLALMAVDMGYQCWGMPNLEVIHDAT